MSGGEDVPELCDLVDVESALDYIAGCGGLSISGQVVDLHSKVA